MKKILVVDDVDVLLTLVSAVLKDAGYHIDAATMAAASDAGADGYLCKPVDAGHLRELVARFI